MNLSQADFSVLDKMLGNVSPGTPGLDKINLLRTLVQEIATSKPSSDAALPSFSVADGQEILHTYEVLSKQEDSNFHRLSSQDQEDVRESIGRLQIFIDAAMREPRSY
ncbi:hypothetical protein BH11PAT2_BH11PAT2_06060 [soil metagenome]